MITIYHVPNSRSLRIVWLMEELGEDYHVERVSFPVGEEFLKVNPLGSVPTIEDDNIVMCESLAILQYLTGRRLVAGNAQAAALTTGPNPDPAAYAEHLQFLHFGESDLAVPLGTIFRTRVFAKEVTNGTVKDLFSQVAKRLAFLNNHLADGREWVTGDRFTIADISIGYAFVIADFAGFDLDLPEHVAAYWQRLQSRPAYQRAIGK
ncbi:glutathione S-transferase [Altererythrobacter atlanticus]|uniref:Glutathione S-transferase GST-6.0 n=1 Tax=Croceibacterium atlanticum TaxID=1267766 RepID=A0A0F7KYD5_9SPHN|nr:glutathione S-transferase family protein [Croceibacterium atlanticum]AKH44237.1 Glutathione S-transferase GST-6.0 [Croceibacterium atlanticum]MBB5732548.1 glutathione S-transferase [Croceibacterium atlanticum]